MTLGRPGALLADRYRLDRLVGATESGERWQAYDERLARPVTARLTPAALDAEHEEAAQTALERLARLNHPGVAAVYDVGSVDEASSAVSEAGSAVSAVRDPSRALSYAISEWTNGRTLAQIMGTGPQRWPRVADWGRQISGALGAMHSLGIVHGALGPNSIAIHDDRQVKILDAGLGPVADAPKPLDEASESVDTRDEPDESDDEAQEPAGSVEVPAGAADDIYALGLLLWETVVGAAPAFVERDVAEDVAEQDAVEDAGGDAGDGTGDDAAEGVVDNGADDGAEDAREGNGRGPDVGPLRQVGVPAELAALFAEMLDADPARRPAAAVAQRRFAPFASAERIGDTLPEIPLNAATVASAATAAMAATGAKAATAAGTAATGAVAGAGAGTAGAVAGAGTGTRTGAGTGASTRAGTRTGAVVPTPQVGDTQTSGPGQRVGSPPAPGAAGTGAAGAGMAADQERRRRRGLLIGLALLLAAIGTGVGLLVANLSPSGAANPNVGDTVVPSVSPGTVLLPNGSPSPSASLAPASAAPPGKHTASSSPRPSSAPPSASASSSPSASPSPSAGDSSSPPASSKASSTPTAAGSDSPAAGGGGSGGGGSGGGAGGGATPSRSAQPLPGG
jgi:eukaryotic-like serine/threonine-protein kinase